MTSTQNRVMHLFGLVIVILLFALVGTFGALFQHNCPNVINHFVCTGIDQTKPQGESVCNTFLISEISIYLGLPWLFTFLFIITLGFFARGTREENTKNNIDIKDRIIFIYIITYIIPKIIGNTNEFTIAYILIKFLLYI